MDRIIGLDDFYSLQFEPLCLRGRADNTRRLYKTTLRNFRKFLGRPPLMADLDNATVSRFLSWFRTYDGGRSAFTSNKERSNLLAIWRFACKDGLIEKWPNVAPDVEPEILPQAWLEDEVKSLFAACDRETGSICGIQAGLWWRALLLVIWDSGERVGAVAALRWEHVSLSTGWLTVPYDLRKGKRADKLYRLAPDTIEALRAMRLPKESRVFPWPYTPNYLWNRFDRLLQRAGLPHDARSKFHRIRRSVASYFEAAGGDATNLLGHSDRKVTRKHYLDRRIVQDKQASDVLFRP